MQNYNALSRSPAYPLIPLGAAYRRLVPLYNAKRGTPTLLEEIAKIIGFTSFYSSGAARSTLVAMRHYGLLNYINEKEANIFPLGIRIMEAPQPSEEFYNALKESAFHPVEFRRLKNEIGSIKNIEKNHIERTLSLLGFTNRWSIETAANAYYKTLTFLAMNEPNNGKMEILQAKNKDKKVTITYPRSYMKEEIEEALQEILSGILA